MENLTVPFGYSAKDYYESRVVPLVLMKWKSVKTNFLTEVRNWVNSNLRGGSSEYVNVKEQLLDSESNFLGALLANKSVDMECGVRAMYFLVCEVATRFYKKVGVFVLHGINLIFF